MNAFEIRRQLIGDYAKYVRSFIHIQDARIGQHVEDAMDSGLLWPDPLIQLNPAFEPGDSIDELVEAKVLHEECSRIFRKDKEQGSNNSGKPLRLYKHQSEAIRCAVAGNNYVLTTGTASGKSLAYIVPIVNHVLRRGSGQGIQAIVVYPMNALANSQFRELKKFLHNGYPEGRSPVRFAQYTGQEKDEQREAILAQPPDILITNYVMLELILTRPIEKRLVAAARGIRFLVMDEMHTYGSTSVPGSVTRSRSSRGRNCSANWHAALMNASSGTRSRYVFSTAPAGGVSCLISPCSPCVQFWDSTRLHERAIPTIFLKKKRPRPL